MQPHLLDRTKAHYDAYPFIEGGPERVDWWRQYLTDYLPTPTIAGRSMIDVGSGIGEISRGLLRDGARMTCLDLSATSLRRCCELNRDARIVNGSALELPFPDASFDHAISIGVLHHTPDCRKGFSEVARVTAPGGSIVIFLYNYWNIYNPIFHAFRPVTRVVPLDRIPRWAVRLLQPFATSHLGQRLNDEQLRRLLGDKLWTPQATFHSVAEVARWGREERLTMVAHKKFYLGYANVMHFKKAGELSVTGGPEAPFQCLSCGHTPMEPSATGIECPSCGRMYPEKEGIISSLAPTPSPEAAPPVATRR